METSMLCIALCGHSGAGKTTLAKLLIVELDRSGISAEHLRIAAPLYHAQQYIYELALRPAPLFDFQDTRLLSFLGGYLREINPDSLIKQFMSRIDQIAESRAGFSSPFAIVCSDARIPDLPHIEEMGFVLVYVEAAEATRKDRIVVRGDANPFQVDAGLEVPKEAANWHYIVENSSTVAALNDRAGDLAHQILKMHR